MPTSRLAVVLPGLADDRREYLPWKYVEKVLEGLAELSWEIIVITDGQDRAQTGSTVHVKTALPSNPVLARALARQVRQMRPDIVVTTMGTTSIAHKPFLSALGAPIVGLVLQYPYAAREIPWREMVRGESLQELWLMGLGALIPSGVKRWGFESARGFVVTSQATYNRLREYGIPQDRILLAPMSLDFVDYASGALTHADFPMRVVYYGSGLRVRGIDLVIDCFEELLSRHSTLELVILDRGDGRFNVERELRRRGLNGRIGIGEGRLPRQDLESWLTSATAVVLPFRIVIQDSPLTVIEPQVLGTPVVTTDVPGIKELVAPPSILVPPGDARALTQAIESLLRLSPLPASVRNSLSKTLANRVPTWRETASRVDSFLRGIRSEHV